MPNVADVIAKYEAADAAQSAGAEPAPEASPGAPLPEGASSGAGSASVDATTDGSSKPAPESPAEATNHDVLEAKLKADRNRRQSKVEKHRIRLERERQEQITQKLEADRKEAEAAKAKWSTLGKDKPWIEALREAGRDPAEVFKEMQSEALKAGTPEAKIEALQKAWDLRHETLAKELAEERQARAKERADAAAEREAAMVVSDFKQAVVDERFGSLLDEYDPPQLFQFADTLRQRPAYLMQQARELGVNLTSSDGSYNMMDILSVMKASADRVQARREQRRTQRAAPQTSTADPKQSPEVSKPTVNGTAERKAGNTIGNDLAASRASEAEQLKNMTREQRSKYLQRKHG